MSPGDSLATVSAPIPLRVLLLEDSVVDAELLLQELRQGAYALTWERVDTATDLRAALQRGPWDVITCDYFMPQLSAPVALVMLDEDRADIPVIIVSGKISEEVAVSLIKAGAFDFVSKENLTRLCPAVKQALVAAEERQARRERERQQTLCGAHTLDDFKRATRVDAEFVGVLAHELRNPLNIIMGYVDLLLEGVFGSLTSEQTQPLRYVEKNAGEILDLFGAALELSRADAGDVALELRDVDVPELLREIEADTSHLRQRQEVAFVWYAASGLPRISTDSVKLKVVLKNLVGNALKFTERGSVMLDAHLCDGGIEFSVADTGVGIAPEALPIIFEAFRQAEATKARRLSGVGLGLYIARRFVELLGGRITVDSRVGLGSIFKVWIPLAVQPRPQ